MTGQQISSVSVYLDGKQVTTQSGGSSSYTFPLDSTSLSVGVHSLRVVAAQQDGMSASATISFSAEGNLASVNGSIASLSSQVSSANGTIGALNSQLSSDQGTISSMMSNIRSLTYVMYALALAAIVALVVAIIALTRRNGPRAESSPASPPSAL